MSNCTALAGHVELGDWVIISGYAGSTSSAGSARTLPREQCGGDARRAALCPGRGVARRAEGHNSEGLKRRGFEAAQISNIKGAYRFFYRSKLKLVEAAEPPARWCRSSRS